MQGSAVRGLGVLVSGQAIQIHTIFILTAEVPLGISLKGVIMQGITHGGSISQIFNSFKVFSKILGGQLTPLTPL